jgi:hypothetical protein
MTRAAAPRIGTRRSRESDSGIATTCATAEGLSAPTPISYVQRTYVFAPAGRDPSPGLATRQDAISVRKIVEAPGIEPGSAKVRRNHHSRA